MAGFLALLPALMPVVSKGLDRIFPDPTEKAKAEAELMKQMMEDMEKLSIAAAGIIQQEAASTHWLAANWRPLTMLVFVGLIVARWMGWAAPNLAEAEYLKLWDIVELGLGGYVIGRTVEKGYPMLGEMLKRK